MAILSVSFVISKNVLSYNQVW